MEARAPPLVAINFWITAHSYTTFFKFGGRVASRIRRKAGEACMASGHGLASRIYQEAVVSNFWFASL
jgi:hypothetical protein